MFKNQLNKLFGNGDETNPKKKIENLVFFIVILIITIIAINFIWKEPSKDSQSINEVSGGKKLAETEENTDTNDSSLSEKLETILGKIQGVGEVKVFINYSESSEVVAMYNENSKSSTTEETDTQGGVRKIEETDTQKDIIYQENDGVKTPMTKKVVEPKIEGAIITAKGASNIEIKTSIIQAVEAATGLATHKIQVFEME